MKIGQWYVNKDTFSSANGQHWFWASETKLVQIDNEILDEISVLDIKKMKDKNFIESYCPYINRGDQHKIIAGTLS